MERFYCPNLECGHLDESESRHCLQVMRNRVGDKLIVFDGRGREWRAEVKSIEGKRAHFAKLEERISPRSKISICLAQAIPKGKAMDLILQKATELGVSEIIPIESERTVARVPGDRAEDKVEKWRETLIEAAKQSGQNWLPEISPVKSLEDFLRERRAGGKLIGSLQPGSIPLNQAVEKIKLGEQSFSSVTVMVGPEGDLTAAEVNDAVINGYLPVTLGDLILRSDTAALYLLSVLKYEFLT